MTRNEKLNQMLVEVVDFLNSPLGERSLKASKGELSVEELSLMSEDEMRIALMLVSFGKYLKEN